jgi:type II secretory ATPase GspE/PulE/Tfp pilus assembly ATPase PilB-like protein
MTFGAQLHLLHVVPGRSTEPDADRLLHARQQLGQQIPAHLVVELSVEQASVVGTPHREICRYAQEHEIDLIVMGTRGRTGIAHVTIGSVAERVLRGAPCPVIVVRSEVPADAAQPPVEELSAESFVPVITSRDQATPALDLITRAVALGATDIHIDPVGREYSARFRIDGGLQRYCKLDSDVAGHLIQQYKTMALLDIADPFHPQEGRLRLPSSLPDLEARITTSPVALGEAVALRLFERDSVFRPLDRLGLSQRSLADIDEMLRRSEGLVLVTGPTGSGKTTTVYSMLETLGTGERNIVSIEDPVEFPASFVRQMEVDERHGVTMTSGLRTLLRMDPDVVFLGEIRDGEAAEISMRAASSGKYVFSTLHTRDVASTVTALRDLHVDSRSLGGNLAGIISQRIVRRLCTECRQPASIRDEEREVFARHGIELPTQLFRPIGCPKCRGSGYRGRIGIFEVALAEESLLRETARGADEHELREMIRATGIPDLTTDALTKVTAGLTSLDEVTRMRSV